jgi:CheY-like chemotaxis protein
MSGVTEHENILVVDDEIAVRMNLQLQLQTSFPSVRVETCSSVIDALAYLRHHHVNVVITDLHMENMRDHIIDPDAGIEVLAYVKRHTPQTQVIVLSIRDDKDAIVRCVRSGAFDYITKPWSRTELISRVKRALDLSNAARDRDSLVERLILSDWDQLLRSTSKNARGEALENLCSALFRTVPGWQRIESRVTTKTEEIDLVILNEAADEFWRRFGSFILVECKNWDSHKKPGRPEFDTFYTKITRRGKVDCRLGFFVSLNGVAATFLTEVMRITKEEIIIAVIDKEDLWQFVCADNRSVLMKEFVRRSVLD